MLEAAVFLSVLNEPDIEWLVANSEQHEIRSGTVIIRRNEPVEFLYLIVDGAFDISISLPQERHIATLYAGELVGEMSFVDLHPPSATVTAGMNSSVLAISKTELIKKIENDMEFGSRFFKGISVLLAGRLRAAYAVDFRAEAEAERNVEMSLLTMRFEEVQRRLGLRRVAKAT